MVALFFIFLPVSAPRFSLAEIPLERCSLLFDATQDLFLQQEAMHLLRVERITVIFVPGYLADPLKSLGPYFDEAIASLTELGIHAVYAPDLQVTGRRWDSERTTDDNGAFLTAYLRKAKSTRERFIILSHSNGGLVSLHGLIQSPDVSNLVLGNASFQSPYLGSVLVDWLTSRKPVVQWSLRTLIRILRGNPRSLLDLTTKNSEAYIVAHAAEIEALARRMPFYTYGSSILDADGKPISSFLNRPLLPWKWMAARLGIDFSPYGLAAERGSQHNDGLVTLPSSRLPVELVPSAIAVHEAGVDHAMPVMNRNPITHEPNPHYDRVAIVKAMLTLLVSDKKWSHGRRP